MTDLKHQEKANQETSGSAQTTTTPTLSTDQYKEPKLTLEQQQKQTILEQKKDMYAKLHRLLQCDHRQLEQNFVRNNLHKDILIKR